MIVMESELEDFRNEILRRGMDPLDFEIEEFEKPMQGVDVQPINGQVTVKRISTGIQKTYKAGQMSHWVVDFADDFRKGVFG